MYYVNVLTLSYSFYLDFGIYSTSWNHIAASIDNNSTFVKFDLCMEFSHSFNMSNMCLFV
jgi:hypothetical protein